MGSAFIRNAKTGALVANAPIEFARVPAVGEFIQLGNALWTVSAVLHGWNAQKQPICEVRVQPPGSEAVVSADVSLPHGVSEA
jgi:hypothetical protein